MKNKKLVVIIIVVIAILLLAFASWLIYKKFIKKDDETKKEDDDVPLAADDSGTTPVVTNDNTQVVTNGPADVKAFQDWMDINHPNWVKGKNLNKGSGYGTFGPSTQKAWSLWKDEYLKRSTPSVPVSGTVNPDSLIYNLKKGDGAYARMQKTVMFKYPDGKTIIGKLSETDLSKPIGVFENYTGNFAKLWMNKSAVSLNGMTIRPPYWAYVYKSMIKK